MMRVEKVEIEDFTEFDIYVEPEEEELDEGSPLDSAVPLTKEELASLTRSALSRKKNLDSSSPIELAKIEAKARDVAFNIAEWVYLAADSGEWKYVYDMNKLGQDYLDPTIQELRKHLSGVHIRSCNSSRNRWIEVSWRTSNEA